MMKKELMTEEFDREIDTLLRQAAQSVDNVSKAQDLHLDADQINAFAENALPAKARLRTMEHLADCSRCRKILADVIAFHSEMKPAASDEIIPLVETKTTVAPWYKRLFIFPQIGYAMGALALILTGIFAVIVLQTSRDKNSSEIAQIEQKSFDGTNLPAVSATQTSANSSANSAMASNASTGLMNSNSSMAQAPAETSRNKNASAATPTAAPGTDIPADQIETDKAAKPEPKTAAPAVEETESSKKAAAPPVVAGVPPAPARENAYQVDGTLDSTSSKQQPAQNSVAQNQTANQTAIMPDSRSVQNLPINGRSTQQMKNRAQMSNGSGAAADKDEARKTETRAVGGKSFRRADGVWYDVKYSGQKTTNVSRGSNDFQKLDGGLRSIAKSLGGVVVIVWKEKAYRIQ